MRSLGLSKDDSVKDVFDTMQVIYGYDVTPSVDYGSVDSEGVLTPPDGDKMYPYVKLAHPDNEALCYIYAYGILSVTDGKETITARFD